MRGRNIGEAVIEAHFLKVNPGGEVLALPIPLESLKNFPLRYRERLLSREIVIGELEGFRVNSEFEPLGDD